MLSLAVKSLSLLCCRFEKETGIETEHVLTLTVSMIRLFRWRQKAWQPLSAEAGWCFGSFYKVVMIVIVVCQKRRVRSSLDLGKASLGCGAVCPLEPKISQLRISPKSQHTLLLFSKPTPAPSRTCHCKYIWLTGAPPLHNGRSPSKQQMTARIEKHAL